MTAGEIAPARTESQGTREGEWEEAGNGATTLGSKAAVQLLDRVKAIPETINELMEVNSDLGTMFCHHYGPAALLRNHEVPGCYKRFFNQV